MNAVESAPSPQAPSEAICTDSGLKLLVDTQADERQVRVFLRAQTQQRCILHWGVRRRDQESWHILPEPLWPEGTKAVGAIAMQTPFKRHNGESRVSISFGPAAQYGLIEFVLFFPEEGRWDNNGKRNYQIVVPAAAPTEGGSPLSLPKTTDGQEETVLERAFEVENVGQLVASVTRLPERYRVRLVTDVPGSLVLHWGLARRSPHEWLQPPENVRPAGTVLFGGHTAQSAFLDEGGLRRLALEFPEGDAPLGIQFVLKQVDEGRWLKHRGGNFYVPIHTVAREPAPLRAAELATLANRIIRAETGPSSWTLMHRFNLCHDLLDGVRGNEGGFALLFVWLRFSAIRQLTWQRNYNTKPRELAHAQDRLTNKLAELYRGESASRLLIRLMLATVGRGGDGQRIRDEILQIMHRHHIKEVSGHFTEEWHQKLHNNTTPDDIVICEAFLEFQRSNGNLDRFYQTLREGGVTRERLESFERPIRGHPVFVPHLKGALIHDFEQFLRILKAVHSSTDLETAINASRDRLDRDTQGLLGQVWNHRDDPPPGLVRLAGEVTEVRRRISHLLGGGEGLRQLLYLDLALEQLVRVSVERSLHQHLDGDQLVDLVGCVLENVGLSSEDAELAACLRHWERLRGLPRFGAEWSLHAKSVVDRIGRALSEWTDRLYQLLQPKAEFLGSGFNAERWTISLFSEEVVRGSSLGFSLSMLLHHLGPVLRQAAQLGAWQIVSRGGGTGKVEVVGALREVQGRKVGSPTVVVAERVFGDEEIPEEVVAVIAPDVTDLVSHVAVRARNAQVLFASCSDPAILDRLKSMRGRQLTVSVTAGGDVGFEEAALRETSASPRPSRARPRAISPQFERFAVPEDQFNEKNVGAKSRSQARLRGKLPDWIRQPASAALPFGVFEHVLSLEENRDVARRYDELAKSELGDADELAKIREVVMSLEAPEELKSSLAEVLQGAGVPMPEDWEATWRCIKQVWASKWNERAVLSRKRVGMPQEDLFMAVLIQPVIAAQYAFVIHTVNPSTGARHELYAEVVPGLGETLVGNYPGRALSFVWDKPTAQHRLLTFPGKSFGLYGGGLIFRSDSNGEDLAGYAGAGLYDSVTLPAPRLVRLDYSEEPLIWDTEFRNNLHGSIARLGVAVEEALGSPQDIEGVAVKGEYWLVQARPQVGL